MSDKPKVWVLKTRHTGDTNNRIAIAQAITADFELVDIYNRDDWSKRLAQGAKDPSTLPDIFVICEQESSNPAKELKRLSKGKVFVVGLQTPDIDNNDFDGPYYRDCTDMQVLFKHHKSAKVPAHHKRIPDPPQNRLAYDYVPTYITLASLAAANTNEAIKSVIHHKPVYMVSLGSVVDSSKAFGHSNWESFPQEVKIFEDNIRQAVRSVAEVAKQNGGSVLVTTSRRTGERFSDIIADELNGVPHYIYDWSKSTGEKNPYQAMLNAADRIIVSGDSISMTADALATGKPTFIYVPSNLPAQNTNRTLRKALEETHLIRDEVKKYMLKLDEAKLIHPIRELITKQPITHPPMNSADEIGSDVLAAWKQFKEKSQAIA